MRSDSVETRPSYREIAKAMGVSEPRVCQLHSDAMKRLRGALAEAE